MKTIYLVTVGLYSTDPHAVTHIHEKKADAMRAVADYLALDKVVTIMRAEDSAKSSPDRAYGAS